MLKLRNSAIKGIDHGYTSLLSLPSTLLQSPLNHAGKNMSTPTGIADPNIS